MSNKEEKQYGLILPNKNKASTSLGIRNLNPLQDSDDELEKDDDESAINWVEASLKKSAGNSGQQNLQKRMVREALEEDASVFQYDEIYDEMQANKSAQAAAKKQAEEKKPKYIHNIIKQAEKRKLEDERRTERKVQKERDEEGDMFADKESFVTPSYLKKMEELKKAEAEAKLEELREEKIDVMKHKNFGAFYNHLFKQKMGESEVKKEPDSDGDEDSRMGIIKKREDPKRQKHYRTQRDLSESPERESRGRPKAIKQEVNSSDSDDEKEVQSYRERREKYKSGDKREKDDKGRERGRSQERARDRNKSDDKAKNDRRDKKYIRDKSHERDRNNRGRHRSRSREHHRRSSRSKSPSNKRDDRRRRESRSRSPQRNSKPHEKVKIKEEPNKSPERKDKKEKRDENSKQERDDDFAHRANVKVKKESELEDKEKRMERIRKLFTKRTVGEKFDQALQRFYIRKAEREANG
ncbi:nuclear speckle splicing regulatory protein 1-like [Palaemon carinicauda]|uniref:nuclear speckle splicing regulatory protein 1-like n=1 Tax=Palaemon carinicauda TaxID=392227 RepID=UPI0035B5DC1B